MSPQRGKRGWHSELSRPPTPSIIFFKKRRKERKKKRGRGKREREGRGERGEGRGKRGEGRGEGDDVCYNDTIHATIVHVIHTFTVQEKEK